MDWTIKDFAHANHNPIVDVNGVSDTSPIVIDTEVGKPITLDASKSRMIPTATHTYLPLVPLPGSGCHRHQSPQRRHLSPAT